MSLDGPDRAQDLPCLLVAKMSPPLIGMEFRATVPPSTPRDIPREEPSRPNTVLTPFCIFLLVMLFIVDFDACIAQAVMEHLISKRS